MFFGATAGTGRKLVKQALELGHDVSAYARNPSKLEDLQHPNLELASGDVLDPPVVANAVAGNEAVLVTIGAGARRTTVREQGTRNIVEAMQAAKEKRLICQSSLGVADSRANLPFFTKYIVVGYSCDMPSQTTNARKLS